MSCVLQQKISRKAWRIQGLQWLVVLPTSLIPAAQSKVCAGDGTYSGVAFSH